MTIKAPDLCFKICVCVLLKDGSMEVYAIKKYIYICRWTNRLCGELVVIATSLKCLFFNGSYVA